MYVVQAEESPDSVDEVSPWNGNAKRWLGPARATAERGYEVPENLPEAQREMLGPIEVTVLLNGWPDFDGLESEGAEPVLFPISGAVAIEVSTIAPGESAGRVASMSPEQSLYRLTELTLAIGNAEFQKSVRERVARRTVKRLAPRPTRKPSQIDFIVIRIHGPKKPVEEFARRIPTAALRRLLRG